MRQKAQISNPEPYLPHQLSWGGCCGAGVGAWAKLKEEIEFAGTTRVFEAILRDESLRDEKSRWQARTNGKLFFLYCANLGNSICPDELSEMIVFEPDSVGKMFC